MIDEYIGEISPLLPMENPGCPHEVGDRIRFKPAAFYRTKEEPLFEIPVEVTGTVVQIHEEHRWYRVQYTMPGCIGHETFKY